MDRNAETILVKKRRYETATTFAIYIVRGLVIVWEKRTTFKMKTLVLCACYVVWFLCLSLFLRFALFRFYTKFIYIKFHSFNFGRVNIMKREQTHPNEQNTVKIYYLLIPFALNTFADCFFYYCFFFFLVFRTLCSCFIFMHFVIDRMEYGKSYRVIIENAISIIRQATYSI